MIVEPVAGDRVEPVYVKPSHPRRERAAALLRAPVVRSLARRLPRWRGALGLNYHRIGDPAGEPWDHALWSTTQARLDRQLAALSADADLVAPSEVAELARDGRPGRHVFVTFDDGYRDNYELAYPVLRARGVRAGFFVATGFVDHPRAAWWDEIAWMVRHARRPTLTVDGSDRAPLPLDDERRGGTIAALLERYKRLSGPEASRLLDQIADATGTGRCPEAEAAGLWMSWDMVRELARGGMEVGGHTVSHPLLARITSKEQARELEGCRTRIHEELGASMRLFAYPVGSRDSFTAQTKELLRGLGVELAFSFYGGVTRFGDRWDPLDVQRVHVDPTMSAASVRACALLPSVLVH